MLLQFATAIEDDGRQRLKDAQEIRRFVEVISKYPQVAAQVDPMQILSKMKVPMPSMEPTPLPTPTAVSEKLRPGFYIDSLLSFIENNGPTTLEEMTRHLKSLYGEAINHRLISNYAKQAHESLKSRLVRVSGKKGQYKIVTLEEKAQILAKEEADITNPQI